MLVTQNGFIKAVSVTPNDTTDLVNGVTRGIFIGTAGTIVLTMADGNDITFTGLSAGGIHLISAKRVKATGTTATNIVALY
jgi:hypothetical protein